MPRKRKPAAKKAAPPRPAGARAEKGKGGAPAKKKGGGSKGHPYSRPSFGIPYFENQGKKKKGGKAAPKPKPKPPAPRPEVPPAEPLPVPEEALVEWRKSHPVTPPTFTGYNTGDLGGGPMQTAPGAPPKQNGAPIYTPAPPASTPNTPTPPEQVSWGQILSDYYASTGGGVAGYQRPDYSTGLPTTGGVQPTPFSIRPDINLETVQQMMSKVAGDFYTSGGA